MLPTYLAVINTEQDRNNFEFLYTTYRKLMFYIANRILNDEQCAEDAVHQAFLKILENFDKVERPCLFFAFHICFSTPMASKRYFSAPSMGAIQRVKVPNTP